MGKKIKDIKPIILHEGEYSDSELMTFKKEHDIHEVIDIYEQQLKELFKVNNPTLIFKHNFQKFLDKHLEHVTRDNLLLMGNWIYFPWNQSLIHMLKEEDFYSLRTNRNRNLITGDEQKKLYDSCVGVVGLSIGSHMAIGMTYQGISKHMKLSEFDSLDTTNLNRIFSSTADVGKQKIHNTAIQIYNSNPYSELSLFEEGLNKDNLLDYIYSKPKPNIIFEAIDDFEMKIHLRFACRKAGIPVVMFSNLGDSIMIDIERYDLDHNLPIFNGKVGNLEEEILKNPMTEQIKHKYAVDIVGVDNVPKRAIESVMEIGKSLVARPQLSSTVTISGALAVYYARQYILYGNLSNGRKLVKFDDIFC